VDVLAWTLCATLEFPSTGWPASGGGNLVAWDTINSCQNYEPSGPGTGVVAAAGYFYLAAYSNDVMMLIPRPVDGLAKVADCLARETTIADVGVPRSPSHLGTARFSTGGGQGYNPCGFADPIRSTTWSGIKTLYE
jgi:hypothetical protein